MTPKKTLQPDLFPSADGAPRREVDLPALLKDIENAILSTRSSPPPHVWAPTEAAPLEAYAAHTVCGMLLTVCAATEDGVEYVEGGAIANGVVVRLTKPLAQLAIETARASALVRH